MSSSNAYSVQDWLVHTVLGVGQIKAIEAKQISGSKVQYYRVEAAKSTFWLPIDRINNEELRPLSTPAEIQLVIAILRRSPKAMSSDHKIRKSKIRRVQQENIPVDIARLIRDLQARQRERGELTLDEGNAMRSLTERLVEEWSTVTGEETDMVTSRIKELLSNPNP